MSANFENNMCYFCDESCPRPSCFISKYHDLWICYCCDDILLQINYDHQENGECGVCFEETMLVKLPTCNHALCLKCCKKIYFGSATIERPIHWREMIIESPDWPYELNDDDDNDPERAKCDEYDIFDMKHFNDEKNSYDELIIIRDSLISIRPEWMNTEDFINYENEQFRYHTEFTKIENSWQKYNENKQKEKGNGTCPFCRANA